MTDRADQRIPNVVEDEDFTPLSEERRQAIIREARREIPRIKRDMEERFRRIEQLRRIAGLPPGG